MRLSAELVDHIFSFLVSHRETLIACSKDPVLSQIVERHLYRSITICFNIIVGAYIPDSGPLGCRRFSRLNSENPRILRCVRILEIQVQPVPHYHWSELKNHLNEFAKTLPGFPLLECIKLITSNQYHVWPDVFRAALKDRLNLPTLKELHIDGSQDFSCSLIDNNANIENLLLSGTCHEANRKSCVSTLPHLKSLTLLSPHPHSVLASLKPHINELRLLKCAFGAVRNLPEMIGMCSKTLTRLDIDLVPSDYSTNYLSTGEVINKPLPELSPFPSDLQQLTIYTGVKFWPGSCKSYLPSAAKIITSTSSVRHLILDIDINIGPSYNLTNVDFSPLKVLGASLSIPMIDLYMHTKPSSFAVTLPQLLSSLSDNDDIKMLIEKGKLVVHSEETAPDYAVRPR